VGVLGGYKDILLGYYGTTMCHRLLPFGLINNLNGKLNGLIDTLLKAGIIRSSSTTLLMSSGVISPQISHV
jgi:hypothetical protein